MTPCMRAKNHKHLIQLQTRTGISVLSYEMRIQHVSGFPCCISSVRSTSVILQLFDPLRFSTSCFSFANVRGKKKNRKQLRLTPGATEPYHWQKTCPPGSPAWESVCLCCGGAWPSTHCASHVFCLAFRISQRRNKTGFHSINVIDLKFRGILFIPFNTAILMKNLT